MADKSASLSEKLVHGTKGVTNKGITEQAARSVPRNFIAIIVAQFLTKLSDAFSSAKIVLPWLMASSGVPPLLAGMTVPIRESGSLIPQIVISKIIQNSSTRKWYFVLGCVLQAISIIGVALSLMYYDGYEAGLACLACLGLLSFSRGFCSVASKDVLGKTIPKTRRGRLGGISATAAGVVSLGVGLSIYFNIFDRSSELIWLLFLAAICWCFGGLIFSTIVEFDLPDVKEETSASNGSGLVLLKTDKAFRLFVIARCLMLSSALLAPFLVILAQGAGDGSFKGAGLFIVVSGLASLVSAKVWGEYADNSSRLVMVIAAMMTAALCVSTSIVVYFYESSGAWIYVLLFFILATIHQGVRLGRKTYVVDIAEGDKRTDYVAVSNTVVGTMLLFVGLVGSLIAQVSLDYVLVFFALLSALGAYFSYQLPEA